MSTKAKAPINRIRPFETKSPRVRRYAVSIRLTKDGGSDVNCREPLTLTREEMDNHKWLTPSALLALMAIHDLPGIVHSLTRPFEVNITLADAYDWDEVHDDIISAFKTAVFHEGTDVTVDEIRRIDRTNGGDVSATAPAIPSPLELAARQALKFKDRIDTSLGVCFAWRDSGGSWFDIDKVCATALADVRDQLDCEGWSTSIERLANQPQGNFFLVVRPGDSSDLGKERLRAQVYDKSQGSQSSELWDESKVRLYAEIRNRQFSERLKSAMDADFPGPFVVKICDATAKHLEYVSETLGRAGWKTHQQPMKVDGFYQPCLIVNPSEPL